MAKKEETAYDRLAAQPDLTPQLEAELAERRARRLKRGDLPKTQYQKLQEGLGHPEGGSANALSAAGMANTAEGRIRQPTFWDAFTFDLFKTKPGAPHFWQTGCARDGLLVGIGAGGTVGALRFVLRGLQGMLMTTNYAVGTFVVAATGMKVWCDRRQAREARGMAAAMAGMKMLNERKAKEREEEKRREEEEAERVRMEEEERRRRQWYKFW